MGGFTSTSKDKQKALEFALGNITDGKKPILMHIKYKATKYGVAFFRLNNSSYSCLPEENDSVGTV